MSRLDQDQQKIRSALSIGMIALAIIWLIEGFFWLSGAERGVWGVLPRTQEGLIGLLTAPLVHGDLGHIASNSAPLVILLAALWYLYREVAVPVTVFSYFTPSLWVWAMARQNWHIGASGMIFALAFFLFFSGILRKEIRTMALSMIVAFLYGGMIWGVLPGEEGISWEGHLFGALTGLILAIAFRKRGPQKPDRWANETYRPEDEYGPWNYKALFPPPEGFQYPEEDSTD
ncbi:MAG: rhomboid family intramembrane serine protease [Bacteroidota bacterium]